MGTPACTYTSISISDGVLTRERKAYLLHGKDFAKERFARQLLLFLDVHLFLARGHRSVGLTADDKRTLVLQGSRSVFQRRFQTRRGVPPRAKVEGLLLRPNHLFRVGVAGGLFDDFLVREGTDLFHPVQRHHVFQTIGLTRLEQGVVDLTRAEDDAFDAVHCMPFLGKSRIRDQRQKAGAICQISEARFGKGVPQNLLRVEEDQLLNNVSKVALS